ncbi:TetR-like C-terminal domain-containing protein, partial [Streptomyces violascens]|uniref:TetR-like C-terminal domain-containing protein n=1 Tax=Streptomyces violascens TaxID=67381 RepID=UPI0036878F0F
RGNNRDAGLGHPDGTNRGQCSAHAPAKFHVILHRAAGREENAPDVETVLDQVVAPMMYRILFRPEGLDTAYARQLVAGLVGSNDR